VHGQTVTCKGVGFGKNFGSKTVGEDNVKFDKV